MFSELQLVTTDRKINLLALNKEQPEGIGLESYIAGRPNLKGGGTWQDSALAPGRRLVYGVKANVSDALTIKIAARHYDIAIRLQAELDSLLEQATDYWTAEDGTDIDPVWIVARVPGESNRRYAIVYGYELSQYPDVYQQPYAGQQRTAVLDGITLGLERSEWRALAPGEGVEVPISNPTNPVAETGGIYVAPQSGPVPTVLAYRYDASAGTYSANVNAGPYPFTLFPNPMGLGDMLYIRTNPSYPFQSLVFNIGTVGTSFSMAFEIWNGATWAGTTVQVNGPSNWQEAGERAIEWLLGQTWATTTVSTFGSAYWLRIVAQGTSATVPTQTAAIYIPNQPYIEVAADQVSGSMDALAMATVKLEEDHRGSSTSRLQIFGQLFAGLRSVDRGSDFNAYLNPGSLPTGITFDASETVIVSGVNPPSVDAGPIGAPYNSSIRWLSDVADPFGEIFRLNFDATAAAQYKGTYRLFVRLYSEINPVLDGQLRYKLLTVYPSNTTTTPTLIEQAGDTITFPMLENTSKPFQTVDLGRITLPPIGQLTPGEQSQGFSLILEGLLPYQFGNQNFAVVDFFLLPIDEWAAQLDAGLNLLRLDNQDLQWSIDSIGQPKTDLRSLLSYPGGAVLGSAQRVSNGPMILHAGRQQRIWFFTAPIVDQLTPAGEPAVDRLSHPLVVRLYKLQRYHFLRGD